MSENSKYLPRINEVEIVYNLIKIEEELHNE